LPQDHLLSAGADEDHRSRVELIEREIGFESLDAIAARDGRHPFAAWIAIVSACDALCAQEAEGLRPRRQIESNMKPAAAACW